MNQRPGSYSIQIYTYSKIGRWSGGKPARTDGWCEGCEHVVLFLETATEAARGYSLSLADATRLKAALEVVLPYARQVQKDLHEGN